MYAIHAKSPQNENPKKHVPYISLAQERSRRGRSSEEKKKEEGKEKALENEGKWNNNVKNENTALGRSSQILPQSFVYSSFIKDVMSIIRFDILSYGLFLYNFVYSYTGYILYNIEYRVDRG